MVPPLSSCIYISQSRKNLKSKSKTFIQPQLSMTKINQLPYVCVTKDSLWAISLYWTICHILPLIIGHLFLLTLNTYGVHLQIMG